MENEMVNATLMVMCCVQDEDRWFDPQRLTDALAAHAGELRTDPSYSDTRDPASGVYCLRSDRYHVTIRCPRHAEEAISDAVFHSGFIRGESGSHLADVSACEPSYT